MIRLMLLLMLIPQLAAAATSNLFTSAQDSVSLLSATNAPQAGRLELALKFQLQPGWHIYWSNPGDAGFAPAVSVAPPAQTGPSLSRHRNFCAKVMSAPSCSLALCCCPSRPRTPPAPSAPTPIGWSARIFASPSGPVFTLNLPGGVSAEAGLFTAPAIVPSPFQASIAPDGTLIVTGPTAAQVSAAHFFPYTQGQIVNRVPQSLSFTNTGLRLNLTPAGGFTPGQPLSGVLELTDASGAMQALSITATPGADLAASAPLYVWLLGAFLGGLLLNLMPCVFPILAMKALTLIKLGGGRRTEIRRDAVGYTAGILFSMLLLGGTLVAVRALGAAVGWGFQLQSPVFVALIAWLMLLSTLNLAGAFTLSIGFGGVHRHHAFFSGCLAVAVATPCTAPFMGGAIAAALASPLAASLGIFVCLGLGLALPFLLLGAVPALTKILPRPGRWMLVLQRALAVPMGLTFCWLAWVLFRQAGSMGLALLLAGGLALGLAATMKTWRPAAWLALIALPFLHTQTSVAALSLPGAAPFSPARLAALRAANTPVFVDITAAWCITCLVNEHAALDTPAARATFAAHHVALLVGDWTNRSPDITTLLQENGRDGVPLYLYFGPNNVPPVTLPQILTPAIVQAAMR